MPEDEEKNLIKLDLSEIPNPALDSGMIPKLSVSNISASLRAIGELSAGLSFGMPDFSFVTAYDSVLASQAKAFTDTIALSERFNLIGSKELTLLSSAVAPFAANIAEIGLISANARKLFEIGDITKEMSLATTKISSTLLEGIAGQQSVLSASLKLADSSGILDIINSISESTQVTSSGFATMLASLPAYSRELTVPSLSIVEKAGKATSNDISACQKKLDKLLAKIDSELTDFRQGCWHALEGKGPDYLGQASSSMRRLVDTILRVLAPDERVVETEYFKNSPAGKDSKGHPTRRARVLFIVRFEPSQSKHLERLTTGFLAMYDNLSAWDHAPLHKELFLEGNFVALEGYLLSLLSENGI